MADTCSMILELAQTRPADAAILSAVQPLQLMYTFVLSLSVTEAFRQFVSEKAVNAQDPALHKGRWVGLVAFLLLALPFIHGMNRYFFDVYSAPPRPDPYSLYLFIDGVAFTAEAAIFFVLARSLSKARWKTFFTTVVWLLVLDVVWGTFVWASHSPQIAPWVLVNACCIPILAVLLRCKLLSDRNGPFICLALIAIRTALDYGLAWKLYFP